jgi:hypothetical protein
MNRLESNKPLGTIARAELVTAVEQLGWRSIGRQRLPDGAEVHCLWDDRGRYVGTVKVMEEAETALTP